MLLGDFNTSEASRIKRRAANQVILPNAVVGVEATRGIVVGFNVYTLRDYPFSVGMVRSGDNNMFT